MSYFNDIKIKLHLSIGYSQASQSEEEYLSNYWSEDVWNNLSEQEKNEWLNSFCNDWSDNYIEQSVWLEED